MTILRTASITQGLIIPEDQAMSCVKIETPNYHELLVASRTHRWPRMRKLHKEFFKALMVEVTEIEIDLLEVLDLPSIDTVRESVLEGYTDEGKPFTYTSKMDREVKLIFDKWIEEVLGTKAVKQVDDISAIFPYYELNAFGIGVDEALEDALKTLPDWMSPDDLMARQVQVLLANPHLDYVIKHGGDRIKTELGRMYIEDIRKALRQMVRDGKGSMKIARYLHKVIGEGKAWYWNRLARSESALANNAAFNASMEKYKIPYVRWSAASNCCDICAYFDNKQWRRNENPEPCSDTHPSCMCVLRTVWVTRKPIQETWDRPSPYDRPYTQAEFELFRGAV